MAKVKKVRYFTKEKKQLISKENLKIYEKYLKSNIIKNKEVKNTTYKVYENYMTQFLVYLAEEWDNISLYSEEFMENAIDIMEGFIAFCQDVLYNNKKVINTKLSAVSSFYLWSLKRGYIDKHPFDKKLDRMKGATEEKIINSYFLTEEQIAEIEKALDEDDRFDIQDKLIWYIAKDSANRIGAIEKLTISSLNMENMVFENIREKRGYRVEVAFSEDTKKLIEQWLKLRKNELDKLELDAFFISKYGGKYRKMSRSTIQERVRKMGTVIGLDDFHIHCIRKTTLNLITEKTNNIELAASLANHKSIETTRSSYIKPKSKAEIRDKIKELMNKSSDE